MAGACAWAPRPGHGAAIAAASCRVRRTNARRSRRGGIATSVALARCRVVWQPVSRPASRPWTRRGRWLPPSTSAASAPIIVRGTSSVNEPVASENTVSPSPVVCDGLIARANPSSAISAMRLTSALDSFAFVATRPMVVLAPGCGCAERGRRRSAPERISVRTSASPLPSSVRTPATTLPVPGSMMSPTAFTATMAATTRPFGRTIAAEPRPPFIERPSPILPTVAPAPAPTLPSGTAASLAPCAAL